MTQAQGTSKEKTLETRSAAALTLTAVMRDGQSLTAALKQQLPKVVERDQGLLQELCFGVARFAPAYTVLAKQLLSKPIKNKETEVQMLLFIGFYQLQHTRIPDHAAINSVVNACKTLKKNWATGLLNGVLRNFIRDRQTIETKLDNNLAYQYAHPQWLTDQLRKAWPNHWQALLQNNNDYPPLTLRINQKHNSREDYVKALHHQESNANEAALTLYAKHGLTLANAVDITTLPGYASGDFSVQDEAAQLSAELLELAPKQRVLDACCAPGGKTCHILEQEPTLAEVVAIDIEASRMERVAANLARLKLDATLKVANAAHLDDWWDGDKFDRILLDAPCSATGVIRRHPDIKVLRRPTDIPQLVELQQKLLDTLWSTLKPGGMMLYATCSVLPAENEQSMQRFFERTPDAQQKIITGVNWGLERPYGRQLLPTPHGHDGFYYCIIVKRT